MKYPRAAVVALVLALVVGVSTVAQGDYASGEAVAMLSDFGLTVGITFAFWYGVVVLAGWLYHLAERRGGGAS